jgi:hypothetical protein
VPQRTVCWFSVKWRAVVPRSRDTAISAGELDESADSMAASAQQHVAEAATGFKNEIRLPWRRFTPSRRAANETG